MNTLAIERRLEILRAAFSKRTGAPFAHFFCPLLYVDEAAELCEAHVVNRAWPGSTTKKTVQRKDIDNFYGSRFEGAFTHLRHKGPGVALTALADPVLRRALRPQVEVGGRAVPFFVRSPRQPLPPDFIEVVVPVGETTVALALKLTREEARALWHAPDQLFVEVKSDRRLPALASLLKAAHLTLFTLLDYSYALSSGGRLLGQLLGRFYVEAQKPDHNDDDMEYFKPYAQLVRPVLSFSGPSLSGSVDDSEMRVCWVEGTRIPWGMLVYIRTGELLHTVLVPVFEDSAGGQERFEAHFAASRSTVLETSRVIFQGDRLACSPDRSAQPWSATNWDGEPAGST